VLYPLYSREGDSITSFPFYYRTNKGADHHVLWPLVKVSDGQVERVAPFWFGGAEEYTLFPIIHRTRNSTTLLVPPSHWRRDDNTLVVFPFYARSGKNRYYAPGIITKHRTAKSGEQELRELTVFPAFHYRKYGDGKRQYLDVLFLAQSTWTQSERELKLFPIAGIKQGSRDDYVWVGPYYSDKDQFLLAPFYYEKETANSSERFILGYFKRESKKRSTTGIVPFYLNERRSYGDGRTKMEIMLFGPVYGKEEVRSATGEILSSKRRFLACSDERDSSGRRQFKILGLPISETVEMAASSS
jgi:hypothetical protein